MDQPGPSGRPWQPSTPSDEGQWRADFLRAAPELEQLARLRQSKAKTLPVLRTSQLDADRLDIEISALLREQFLKIFAHFRPGLIAALQPELSLILDYLIFANSVWAGRPTPGSVLLNLRFRDESRAEEGSKDKRTDGLGGRGPSRRQRALFGLGTVLARYVWSRAEEALTNRHWASLHERSWVHAAWRGMAWGGSAFHVASLLNFLVFLRQGVYRSLLERALSMRLVYAQPAMTRALSFEYLNRHLVWAELSELLLFLLPLLNVGAVKRFLRDRLRPPAPATAGSGSDLLLFLLPLLNMGAVKRFLRERFRPPPPATAGDAGTEGEAGCSFCSTAPIPVPYTALPCGHMYCYFCLRQQCAIDPQFRCAHCSKTVVAMRASLPARVPAEAG